MNRCNQWICSQRCRTLVNFDTQIHSVDIRKVNNSDPRGNLEKQKVQNGESYHISCVTQPASHSLLSFLLFCKDAQIHFAVPHILSVWKFIYKNESKVKVLEPAEAHEIQLHRYRCRHTCTHSFSYCNSPPT